MYWVRILVGVIFHPIDAFDRIKYYRSRSKTLPIFVMFCLVLIVRVASIYITHFPMTTLKPEDTNILLEIIKYIVPLASWGVANYAITSIWDGECFLEESMIGAAASMVPYVLLTIPVSLFSRLLEINQIGFYNFLNIGIFVWIIMLLFIGTMTMNNYSFKTTISVYIISIIGVILLWALVLLLATLVYQLYDSIKDLTIELRIHLGI